MRIISVLAVSASLLLLSLNDSEATIPPRPGASWPQAYYERIRTQPGVFTYTRALQPMVQRIRANQAALARGEITRAVAMAQGGLAITGSRSVPVLASRFSNTSKVPYSVANLQTQLFTGPWPTGTMTQYYQEISYGQFSVTGTVFDWQKTTQDDTFYEGPPGCKGICGTARTGKFIQDTLDLNDPTVDFSQYDNDGADGVPNSGDDDGYVDFVAFVHAESGGECGNYNIWSHRWNYSGWTGIDYITNDSRHGGGFIRIDDYVVMPALACDEETMIQIGVFAHEFGHAFGLPDLYDTDPKNGKSQGIGNWGLMATGSWGGDGKTPELPTHMSAWSKEFLGWINPIDVTVDQTPATIDQAETNAIAFKISINADEYYLVSNRQQKLFDINLPQGGLLVWHINQAVVNSGLTNNRVNADHNNKGVDLEEADGKYHLDNSKHKNRGDAGDIFPGSSKKRRFDSTTNPASSGSVALCEISGSADSMTANFLISTNNCSGDGTKTTSFLTSPSPQNLWDQLLAWTSPGLPPLAWISQCAVERRFLLAGAKPVRQLSLQPVAVGAVQGANELD